MVNVTVITFMTTTDVCRLFDRSPLTIANWRKYNGLPYVVIKGTGRDTIRFKRDEVIRWAQRNRKRIHVADTDEIDIGDDE